jgi:hypothetical protein
MWRIRWVLNNASRWQMGFNLEFKGLINTGCRKDSVNFRLHKCGAASWETELLLVPVNEFRTLDCVSLLAVWSRNVWHIKPLNYCFNSLFFYTSMVRCNIVSFINYLQTNINLNFISKRSQCCAVNTFHLRYKNQFVAAVYRNNCCSEIYAKYKNLPRGLNGDF